jgi:hypothetical protein
MRIQVLAAIAAVALASPIASADDGGYGAIAYSLSTRQWGTSSGMGSLADARDAAVFQCGAGDCVMVTWEHNAIAVLATGIYGGYGTATHASDWGWAATTAQNSCFAVDTNCAARTWVSS